MFVVNNDTIFSHSIDTLFVVNNDSIYRFDTVYVSRTDTIHTHTADTLYIVSRDTIWLSPTAPCHLNILSNDIAMGIVDGGGKFEVGAEASISAIPRSGFRFTQWSDGNLNANRTIILENDVLLMAYFEPIMYTISARSANVNMGIAYGSGNYAANSTVEIAALPNYGYHFVRWNDGETSNPRKINVTSNNYELLAATNDKKMGKVTGAATYEYLSRTQIRATANSGYHFTGWSDGETENPRNVLVYSDTSFVAMFEADIPYNPSTPGEAIVHDVLDVIHNIISVATDVEDDEIDKVNIYSYGNIIIVENAENGNNEIEIFDINGRMIAKTTANSSHMEIPMTTQGVYIVRVGANAKRVIVN